MLWLWELLETRTETHDADLCATEYPAQSGEELLCDKLYIEVTEGLY